VHEHLVLERLGLRGDHRDHRDPRTEWLSGRSTRHR
jgi:hypothetical protein